MKKPYLLMFGLLALMLGYGAYQTLFATKAVYNQHEQLETDGRYTVATVTEVVPRRKMKTSVHFEYMYNGQKLSGTENFNSLLAPKAGDKLYVAFLPDQPGITSLKGEVRTAPKSPAEGWKQLPE